MQIVDTLTQAQAITAIARAAMPDGRWIVYQPGDTLPPDLFGAPSDPNPVPAVVTKRQLYRGLMQVAWLGATQPQIDAAVSAMLSKMPDPPREIARSDFFTSRDYYRTNELLVGALKSPPLSKTDAQIDDFFRLCGSFPAEG